LIVYKRNIVSFYPLLNSRLISKSLQRLLLLFAGLILVGGIIVNAQSGPGGVGSSGNNLLWLKADAGTSTTVTGLPITSWLDQSGNAMNATQGTPNRQPKYVSNAMNGRPAVLFNNTDGIYDYLNLPGGFSNFTAGLSAFVVTNPIAAGSWDNFFNLGTIAENIGLMRFNISNNLFYEVYAGGSSPGGMTGVGDIINGTDQIFGILQNGGVPPATSNAWMYRNNAEIANDVNINVPRNIVRNSNYIGHDSWGSGDMNGEIAEIIIYNTRINTAQRYIIENYLSSKYGIALTGNDYFNFDATHSYEVAGIGRVNASNIHNNATSSGILNISNALGMSDNEYLLFGQDNGAVNSFGTVKCDYNLALAHVLSGNYNAATATLNCAEKTAEVYYLQAIVGARTSNDNMVFENLKKAISLDGTYRETAKEDREFLKYYSNADFQNAIK